MIKLMFAIVMTIAAGSLLGQQPSDTIRTPRDPGTISQNESANLPVGPIGRDDLIGILVYDAPELSRTVLVDANGKIRLPMLEKHIQAAGLYPEELEKSIRTALVDEQILTDPIVTVSVVESRSRPINVVGAVRTPVSFQAIGTVTLFDALSRAGGLTENAGSEILVSSQKSAVDGELSPPLVRRVSVRNLLDGTDPSLNLRLEGGEIIRVPESGHFFVVGDVKEPGQFSIGNGSESSVLKALALTRGLNAFSERVAYIFRTEGGAGGKTEIPVELKKIMDRKSPDVPLMANDILYVPEATGRKTALEIARGVGAVGLALSTTLIYLYH